MIDSGANKIEERNPYFTFETAKNIFFFRSRNIFRMNLSYCIIRVVDSGKTYHPDPDPNMFF